MADFSVSRLKYEKPAEWWARPRYSLSAVRAWGTALGEYQLLQRALAESHSRLICRAMDATNLRPDLAEALVRNGTSAQYPWIAEEEYRITAQFPGIVNDERYTPIAADMVEATLHIAIRETWDIALKQLLADLDEDPPFLPIGGTGAAPSHTHVEVWLAEYAPARDEDEGLAYIEAPEATLVVAGKPKRVAKTALHLTRQVYADRNLVRQGYPQVVIFMTPGLYADVDDLREDLARAFREVERYRTKTLRPTTVSKDKYLEDVRLYNGWLDAVAENPRVTRIAYVKKYCQLADTQSARVERERRRYAEKWLRQNDPVPSPA